MSFSRTFHWGGHGGRSQPIGLEPRGLASMGGTWYRLPLDSEYVPGVTFREVQIGDGERIDAFELATTYDHANNPVYNFVVLCTDNLYLVEIRSGKAIYREFSIQSIGLIGLINMGSNNFMAISDTGTIYKVTLDPASYVPTYSEQYQLPDGYTFDRILSRFEILLKKSGRPDGYRYTLRLLPAPLGWTISASHDDDDTENVEGGASSMFYAATTKSETYFFSNSGGTSGATKIKVCTNGVCTNYDTPTDQDIAGIAIKESGPVSGNPLVIAAGQGGDIITSTDRGQTWVISARLGQDLNISNVEDITYSSDYNMFYLAYYDDKNNLIILASENGSYWENINVPHYSKIAGTRDSYCAIENDPLYPLEFGQISCWGSNDKYKLGLGSNPEFTPTPTRALIPAKIGIAQGESGPISYQKLAGGDSHMCAVRASGNKIDCWGDGELGQLGDGIAHAPGYATPVPTPVNLSGIGSVDKLVAGGSHSCILSSGKISCWGSNIEKEIDSISTQTIFPSPAKAIYNEPFSYTDVAAGGDFTCAISPTQINCWGNHYSPPYQSIAISDPSFSKFTSISAAGQTACVLSNQMHDKGTNAWCWGDNTYGQIGNGISGNSTYIPQKVVSENGNLYFVNISQSVVNTCGITDKGLVYCWGDNTYKQTGLPDTGLVLKAESPINLGGIPGSFTTVATGLFSTCLVSAGVNMNTYCWGINDKGQVGVGIGINLIPQPSFLNTLYINESAEPE